jgi:hypothetical protein
MQARGVNGKQVPSTPYPLMELRVGSNPSRLLTEVESMSGVGALGIVSLCVAYFLRPRRQQVRPERAFATGTTKATSRS